MLMVEVPSAPPPPTREAAGAAPSICVKNTREPPIGDCARPRLVPPTTNVPLSVDRVRLANVSVIGEVVPGVGVTVALPTIVIAPKVWTPGVLALPVTVSVPARLIGG